VNPNTTDTPRIIAIITLFWDFARKIILNGLNSNSTRQEVKIKLFAVSSTRIRFLAKEKKEKKRTRAGTSTTTTHLASCTSYDEYCSQAASTNISWVYRHLLLGFSWALEYNHPILPEITPVASKPVDHFRFNGLVAAFRVDCNSTKIRNSQNPKFNFNFPDKIVFLEIPNFEIKQITKKKTQQGLLTGTVQR